MLKLINAIVFISLFLTAQAAGKFCDETRSYNKVWLTQARDREAGHNTRERYYKTLSAEELARISDVEMYPTPLMTCGMGFSDGLAKVRVNRKVGFIDKSGKIVIRPQFSDAGRFSAGLAPVEFSHGKWGYIDKTGATVIKPVFDWALLFREGLALVQVGKKWGYINTTGALAIPAGYDHANSFSEGLAHVQVYKEKYFSGYIDKSGRWVIPPIFNGGDDFGGGTTIADIDVLDKDGHYKYTEAYRIDRSGKKLEEVEPSRTAKSPNLLDADDISLIFDERKTGYSDRNGRIIWKPTE